MPSAVTPSHPPRLAPPGAGLPGPERFIAGLILRWTILTTSRVEASERFAAERDRLLQLVAELPEVELARPVLIKRLPGLEDSSRYWSVAMVVDHLNIVNREIIGVIGALTAGRVPARAASTAAVKPQAGRGGEVVDEFREVCADFLATVNGPATLRTAATYAHPWFGPLSAAEWHVMAAFHQRLHRKQAEAILAGMGRA